MTKISGLIDQVGEFKTQYQEASKNAFKEILKEFFDNSDTQAFVWGQYTPGFNDGDPCEFGLTEIYCISEGFNENDIQDPYEYDSDDYKHNDSEEAKSIIKFLNDNLDMLEDMFGNYVLVCVTPEKIITEEYDCGY